MNDEQVLTKIAQKFTGRERHRLSDTEREIVKILEDSGHLSVRKSDDEYIGQIVRRYWKPLREYLPPR